MSFLISDAWAQTGAAGTPTLGLADWLPLIFIFVVAYFLLIRPQAKKAKEHRKMVAELAKGDEVVTGGGLLGRITEVGEGFVLLEVAQGIEVKVQKHAVSSLMPKGTMKTL
jgi:preprotein translocase subunit YajC